MKLGDEAARRLCAAVLLRAVEDVRGVRLNAPTQSPDKLAADALEFLRSPAGVELANALGFDGSAVVRRVECAPVEVFTRCGRKPGKPQNGSRTSVSAS